MTDLMTPPVAPEPASPNEAAPQATTPIAADSIGSLALAVRSAIITVGLTAVVIFWPLVAIERYREIQASTLGFQLRPQDPAIMLGALLWIAIVATLIGSFRPLRTIPGFSEVQSSFRRVCADSYFGLGHYRGWTYTDPDATFDLLEQPDPDAMPPVPTQSDQVGRFGASAAHAAPVVVVPVPEPVEPIQTTDYVVERRESWWSIAETVTGEAKHWGLIRDLNIGTEIAPGIVIDLETPLRSGWTIQVPADTSAL